MGKENTRIKKIFENVVERENPKAKYWYYPTSEFHIIDMPRNNKLHGSSIAFRCNERCEANGDIITYDDPEIVDMVKKKLKQEKCKYLGTHKHGLLVPEAHIHLECKRITMDNVRKLMDLVKWF